MAKVSVWVVLADCCVVLADRCVALVLELHVQRVMTRWLAQRRLRHLEGQQIERDGRMQSHLGLCRLLARHGECPQGDLMPAVMMAPMNTARRRVRRGSRISSPTFEAISNPSSA